MHQKCDLTVSFLSNQYISENFDIMAVWIHMGFKIWSILQDFLASAKWCYFSLFSSRSPFFKWLFLNEEQHSQWPAHMDLCIEMCSFWISNHQADWNKREFTGLCRLGKRRAVLDRPPGGLTKTAPRQRVKFLSQKEDIAFCFLAQKNVALIFEPETDFWVLSQKDFFFELEHIFSINMPCWHRRRRHLHI